MLDRSCTMRPWRCASGVVLAVLLLAAGDVALGCPSCKLAAGDETSSLARGYFWSILFMLSMPPLILASLGLYFYCLVRKARSSPPASLPASPPGAGAGVPRSPLGAAVAPAVQTGAAADSAASSAARRAAGNSADSAADSAAGSPTGSPAHRALEHDGPPCDASHRLLEVR